MMFLSVGCLFRFHVNFPGCRSFFFRGSVPTNSVVVCILLGASSRGQGGQKNPFVTSHLSIPHIPYITWVFIGGISYIPFKRAPTAGAPHSKGTTIFPMILCCFDRICQKIITKWILNTCSKQQLLFCFFSAPFHTGDGNNSSTS